MELESTKQTERFALELAALRVGTGAGGTWPITDAGFQGRVRMIADTLVPSVRVFIASTMDSKMSAFDLGIIGTMRAAPLHPGEFPFNGPAPADPVILVRMDGPTGRVRVEAFERGMRNGYSAGSAAMAEAGGGPPATRYFMDDIDLTPVLESPALLLADASSWKGSSALFTLAHPRILAIVAACEEEGAEVTVASDVMPEAILYSDASADPYKLLRKKDYRAMIKQQHNSLRDIANVRLSGSGRFSAFQRHVCGALHGPTEGMPAACSIYEDPGHPIKIVERYFDAGICLPGPVEVSKSAARSP